MSYRLIDANEIAMQCPEVKEDVNDMPCIYADLDDGLDGRYCDLRRDSTLQAENAKLRDLCADIYRTARLLDANAQIVGLKLKSEAREDWERRMGELGVDL